MDHKEICGKLVLVLREVDTHLPHRHPLPEDAPRPAWCAVVREGLGYVEEDCCGACQEWSEAIITALNEIFKP